MNQSPSPDLIEQFIARYRREFDFYEQAGRIVAQQIDGHLESSGIRAMVTFRAKNPKRLEAKVRQRNVDRNYASIEDIYADIVDLAGIRVALYFPGERAEVDKIIQTNFNLTEDPKKFTGTSNPSYEKRFSGYWATHYRLQILESTLSETNKRFADARVEVQVASVLMHAWSEVEHDLVYKPVQGSLSEDELAILDELNGMVLTGEIALERLQRAAKIRVSVQGSSFDNHYDLASFLLQYGRSAFAKAEPVIGDVELLYRLLVSLNISRAEQLNPYLESLTENTEQRPLAQQIIDQIVSANPERYATYAALRSDAIISGSLSTNFIINYSNEGLSKNAVIGSFILQWTTFEHFLILLAREQGLVSQRVTIPTLKLLTSLNVFSDSEVSEIDHIRRIRNYVVHGIEMPDLAYIKQAGDEIMNLLEKFCRDPRDNVRMAAKKARDASIQS